MNTSAGAGGARSIRVYSCSFVVQNLYLVALAFCLAACRPAAASVVVLAPHPDDAEASCGGLIVNTVAAGEKVIILTMTGGEHGIPGKIPEEARAIRREEAQKAAETLGAEVAFFGVEDAHLEATAENLEKLIGIFLPLNPAIVLATWPLDVHPDHQATGMLAWRAFRDKRLSFDLYFYETSNEPHTKSFQFVPTHYIDITDALKKKQESLYRHESQLPRLWFDMYKIIARLRGYESDTAFAEAFIRAGKYSSLGGRPAAVPKTLTAPE